VDGSITSDVTVAVDAELMGDGVITGDTNIDGTWLVEWDGVTDTVASLDFDGDLDLTDATIRLTGEDDLDIGEYVIGTYTTLTGNPAVEVGPLGDWSIDYAYGGGNQIALIVNEVLSPSRIPGDANGDGKVDETDAQALATNWGTSTNEWSNGDFNDDGVVNILDAAILAAHWGTGVTEGTTTVPEPGVFALLLGLALALAPRRNRR
jgi:hypothetical protein